MKHAGFLTFLFNSLHCRKVQKYNYVKYCTTFYVFLCVPIANFLLLYNGKG